MKLYGERLKERRVAAKLTRKALAVALEVHYKTVGRWERGEDVPSARIVALQALVLGTTVAYLTGLINSPRRMTRSAAEREMLELFRALSKTSQEAVLETIREAAGLEHRERRQTAENGC